MSVSSGEYIKTVLRVEEPQKFPREITATADSHGTRPVKATMIDNIDDTDSIGPSLLRDLCPSQPQGRTSSQHVLNI